MKFNIEVDGALSAPSRLKTVLLFPYHAVGRPNSSSATKWGIIPPLGRVIPHILCENPSRGHEDKWEKTRLFYDIKIEDQS